MRNLLLPEITRFRCLDQAIWDRYGTLGDAFCGVFIVPSAVDRGEMHVIASTAGGWDHVSVSRKNRCPNWPEMDAVKRLFFQRDETVMQLHVPVRDHVNLHPYTLHLWRPNDGREIPRPPKEFVG